MASFYRKWRPQTFDDLVGQEHIKKTLTNALKTRKIAHAYLFTGPRGTGKTTTARLLAKSLNCEKVDYKNKKSEVFEPCNECSSCEEISAGQSLDVIEIDAASNRGIEEIRELREKVRFSPVKSLFKVFIIDEVHMLTREAFNALLKTLEEPPAHVIFILATTEAHKVLPTIISRCQRFDFRRGKLTDVKKEILHVVSKENLEIEEEAAEFLATISDGSYRDAVSLLNQVASVMKAGEKIGIKDMESVLGIADSQSARNFLNLLVKGDVPGVVELLKTILDSGGDLIYFVNQIIGDVRKLVLLKTGVSKDQAAPNWNDEELAQWAKVSLQYKIDELLVLLNDLVLAISDIKKSPLPQLPIEVMSIGWMQRFDKLKEEGKEIEVVCAEPVIMQDLVKVSSENSSPVNAVDSVSSETKNEIRAEADDKRAWEFVVERVKPLNHSLHTVLKDAYVKSFESDKVVVGVRFRFHSERIHDRKNKEIIEKVLEEVCGKKLRLECLIDEKIPKPKSVLEQDILTTAVEVFGMEE